MFDDVLVFRAREKCDLTFLYYVLASDNFFDYATATSKGAKMPRGDKGAIMNFEAPCFDMETQRRIGITLGKLRDVRSQQADKRLVYFDARAKIHLQNYLEGRTDENPALFVSLKAPFDRLMIGGVEARLRELGKRLNIPKVHPHKFRRTLATTAIDKGMPIEQVQQLLGHQKIDTTMHYAMVKQQNVKLAHRKYIG